MTPQQFEDAIAKLGLLQSGPRGAGCFLGIGDRQIRKWIAGEAKIPQSVAMLLRLMIERGIKPEEVTQATDPKQAVQTQRA
jgi:hypothetical protein